MVIGIRPLPSIPVGSPSTLKRGIIGSWHKVSAKHLSAYLDEMTFRFTYRVDGKPLWHTPLTPFKGSNTKSPFIFLAQR